MTDQHPDMELADIRRFLCDHVEYASPPLDEPSRTAVWVRHVVTSQRDGLLRLKEALAALAAVRTQLAIVENREGAARLQLVDQLGLGRDRTWSWTDIRAYVAKAQATAKMNAETIRRRARTLGDAVGVDDPDGKQWKTSLDTVRELASRSPGIRSVDTILVVPSTGPSLLADALRGADVGRGAGPVEIPPLEWAHVHAAVALVSSWRRQKSELYGATEDVNGITRARAAREKARGENVPAGRFPRCARCGHRAWSHGDQSGRPGPEHRCHVAVAGDAEDSCPCLGYAHPDVPVVDPALIERLQESTEEAERMVTSAALRIGQVPELLITPEQWRAVEEAAERDGMTVAESTVVGVLEELERSGVTMGDRDVVEWTRRVVSTLVAYRRTAEDRLVRDMAADGSDGS